MISNFQSEIVFTLTGGIRSVFGMSNVVRSVHFIGIGGTAMAATAAAMKARGYKVSGSDLNVYPPMSTFLASQDIPVGEGYQEAHLDSSPDLVVIGNAISRGNPEAEAVLERKLPYVSLPELLKREFIQGRRSLVVTGTHGKTTTTALLTWVFEQAGLNPSFLIGGIPANFQQGARFTDSDWFIIEGDEYDTAFFDKRSKFVHYQPEVAILNNLEFDHADIFADLTDVQRSFEHFLRLIPRNGLLLANGDCSGTAPLLGAAHYPVQRFGLGETNTLRATDLGLFPDHTEFVVGTTLFRLPLSGSFNVRNALAVVGCARHCGLSDDTIQSGFDTFRGVARRMEVRGIVSGIPVIDDFGHHPTAIRETLEALRVRYPSRRLWAVFEPRSNTTRRNVFQEALADALQGADRVLVAEVARLEQLPPENRLNPGLLIATLQQRGCPAAYLPSVEVIVDHLESETAEGDVICVFSNGGFGGIHARLLGVLQQKFTSIGN
jgi:UDP-N-acetylmuramate: L-alanyl-gamma-D-glutamyl-meso-diaminopimelate ligase